MNNYYLPIRLLLADDHEIFRDGFRVMLKKQQAVDLVGEAENGQQLIDLARELQPDVIITDIKMPVLDGIAATRQLVKELPDIGIIALSMFDEENLIADMLQAGAKGYLLKNAAKDEIVAAVQAVHKKQTYYCSLTSKKLANLLAASSFDPHKRVKAPEFTDKELQVIRYICEGLSSREIAQHLFLSVRSIEGYRERIQEKMNVHNTAGVVVYAIRHRIYEVQL